MNDLELDPTFSNAFRTALVEVARGNKPRRHRLWFGAAFAGLLLATGAGGVATATLMAPPGAPVYEHLGDTVTRSLTETGIVDLGSPPAGANSISFTVVCHTEGSWTLEGYGSAPCFPDDLDRGRSGSIPLTLSQQSIVLFELEPGTRLTITAAYSKKILTDLGINAAGETYGTGLGECTGEGVYAAGECRGPDLAAATATNGNRGYIRESDIAEVTIDPTTSTMEEVNEYLASGKGDSDKFIPVYEADGKTIVGQYLIAGYDSQRKISQAMTDAGISPPTTAPAQ
jgi:hypothetical protein